MKTDIVTPTGRVYCTAEVKDERLIFYLREHNFEVRLDKKVIPQLAVFLNDYLENTDD